MLPLVALLLFACHAAERPVALREAEVRIVVDDTASTLSSVVESVEAAGGSVVQSDVWREDGALRASVILQVPSRELMRTLAKIRAAASAVEHEQVRSANAPTGVPNGVPNGAPATRGF